METKDPKEIEQLIEDMKANKVSLKPEEIMEQVGAARYFIPVVIRNAEVLKRLNEELRDNGKAKLPPDANPMPVLINNGQKEQFVGIYTAQSQIPNNVRNNSIIQMPFGDAVRYAQNPEHKCSGVVINPFTQNFVLKLQRQEGERALTPDQIHELARRNVEFALLPHGVYKEGKDYFDHINADFLYGLYAGQYKGNLVCPIRRESIEVMNLAISRELDLIDIVLPKSPGSASCAKHIVITWNKTTEQGGYYLISDKFLYLNEDGSIKDLGALPAEGSEMSTVLDIIGR